ncbi:MAG: sugar ABC transporter permease [Anaerolineaceae bacterium]|nr:MAG: sugar ABC transporter permease [Anaerolineaceae bacterium]
MVQPLDKPLPSATTDRQRLSGRIRQFIYHHRDTLNGYGFLLPFLIIYLTFLIFPLLRGVWISLHDWDLLIGNLGWTGLDNYTRMFTRDNTFWLSTRNTVQFVALSTIPLVSLGLLIAVALNRPLPLMGLFRTIFFSSYVLSISVVTLIWFMLLNPNRGILAAAFQLVGLEPIAWLNNVDLAMPAIVVTSVWWTMGFNVVLFLAGLQDIPRAIYEAAEIDGASAFRRFFSITLPMLKRTVVLVFILQIIASFQIFGQVFLMTRGGPAGSTRVLVQHIYERGFRGFELGYGSAMSMFLFSIMLAISLIQLYVGSRGDQIESGMK